MKFKYEIISCPTSGEVEADDELQAHDMVVDILDRDIVYKLEEIK